MKFPEKLNFLHNQSKAYSCNNAHNFCVLLNIFPKPATKSLRWYIFIHMSAAALKEGWNKKIKKNREGVKASLDATRGCRRKLSKCVCHRLRLCQLLPALQLGEYRTEQETVCNFWTLPPEPPLFGNIFTIIFTSVVRTELKMVFNCSQELLLSCWWGAPGRST